MRRSWALFGATILLGCSQQGGNQQPLGGTNSATKEMMKPPPDVFGSPVFDRTTKQVGLVAARLENDGVVVSLDVRGLPPGVHGVHIHENAKCGAPTFAAAGGHWNWTNKKHGHENPKGHHAGDLGNITVPADGSVQARFVVPKSEWDGNSTAGLSVVIHAAADDERTDPSGNSGERIACGLLFLRR